MDFDWYLSPADRFSYETQFSKTSKNEQEVYLTQLEPIFQLSRLTQEEFLQIWNLLDIKASQKLNEEQFIYFMHVLTARRKGKILPVGIPLQIKESFLKDVILQSIIQLIKQKESKRKLYTRPSPNSTSNIDDSSKTIRDLELELQDISLKMDNIFEERTDISNRLGQAQTTEIELAQVCEFKGRHAKVLKDDLKKLQANPALLLGNNENIKVDSTAAFEIQGLMEKLMADKNFLEKRKIEILENLTE